MSARPVSRTLRPIFEADFHSEMQHSFGMLQVGRNFNSPEYKYSFNGKLKDDEAKGSGNSYDFGERIYDPRAGRFSSTDPMYRVYPDISNYSFGGNNPIFVIDKSGQYLQDANGNIIYVKVGKESEPFQPDPATTGYPPGYQIRIQKVLIFANDGTPIEVQIVTQVIRTSDNVDVTKEMNKLTYTCHATTMANRLGIVASGGPPTPDFKDRDVHDLIRHDRGWTDDVNIKDKSSTDFDKIEKGDVLLIFDESGYIVHSATYIGDGKYKTKNGNNEEAIQTLNEIKKIYKQDLKRGSAGYIKSVENKTIGGSGTPGIREGSVEYASEEEVQKEANK